MKKNMKKNPIEIISDDFKFHSPYSHRVILLCREKNISYKLTSINIYQPPQWFIDLSPYGTVPVLRLENGDIISDSQAICEYLDSISQPYLIPTEALKRAQHRTLLEFANDFGKSLAQFLRQRKNTIPDLIDINRLLSIADKQIKGTYFLGDEISFFDLAFIPHILQLNALEEKIFPFTMLRKYEKLYAWSQTMMQRPCVKKTSENFNLLFLEHLHDRGLFSQFNK